MNYLKHMNVQDLPRYYPVFMFTLFLFYASGTNSMIDIFAQITNTFYNYFLGYNF
jgi:hypothetical protein